MMEMSITLADLNIERLLNGAEEWICFCSEDRMDVIGAMLLLGIYCKNW